MQRQEVTTVILWTIAMAANANNERVTGITSTIQKGPGGTGAGADVNPLIFDDFYTAALFGIRCTVAGGGAINTAAGKGVRLYGAYNGNGFPPAGDNASFDRLWELTTDIALNTGVLRTPTYKSNDVPAAGEPRQPCILLPPQLLVEWNTTAVAGGKTIVIEAVFLGDFPEATA